MREDLKELQTILGTDIPISTRGIVYLCAYTGEELIVGREILCDSSFNALNLYSNIPNPESQLVMGKTFDELIKNLHELHENIKDAKWLKELGNAL